MKAQRKEKEITTKKIRINKNLNKYAGIIHIMNNNIYLSETKFYLKETYCQKC